jgi:hypothetical protein
MRAIQLGLFSVSLGGHDRGSIDPDKIIAVAADGDQCTVLWLPPRHVVTGENPDALLNRLGDIESAFAKFNRPNMTPVWIKVTAITDIRAAPPGVFAPGVHTVLYMGSDRQGVQEEVQAANERISQQRLLFSHRMERTSTKQ